MCCKNVLRMLLLIYMIKEVDLFYEKAKQLASNARVRVTQDDDTEMKLPHEQEIG